MRHQSCITIISSKIRQTILVVVANQIFLMLKKVDDHEHFRCFTQNIVHLPWLIFQIICTFLKELLAVI